MESIESLWEQVCVTEAQFLRAGARLSATAPQRLTAILKTALRGGRGRETALHWLVFLPESVARELLGEVLRLCSFAHGGIHVARLVVLRIDRRWILANIDRPARDVLNGGGGEEYLRLAELFELLGPELLASHLQRCRLHPSEEVREVPSFFSV